MTYVGDFRISSVVRWAWNSNAVAGESITRATNGTISVYKDGGTTQSTTGVTDTEDWDSLTGVHLVAVDTSADGTFYSAGSDFLVVLSGATIDGKSINSVLFGFSLENRSALMPTTAGRKLDVTAGGEAGIDWANIGSPTTTVNLSGTTVKTATDVETDTADIQGRLPAALVGGRMDADVGNIQDTAAKDVWEHIPSDPEPAAGSYGETLISVGQQVQLRLPAALVGGRMDSSVGAMAADVLTAAAIAADAITAAKIATGAIDADALAADAVTEIQSGLATSASQTTILDRIGAFTGTGVNTVLGFLKALMSKTASTPSDVGGTFAASTDSTEAIRDRGDAAWGSAGGGASAADVWAYTSRTLTQSAAAVEEAVSGSTLTCLRGDSFSASLTNIGSLTGHTKLYFTVKAGKDQADSASIIQIEKTAGLVYLNGAAGTANQGTLTVDDEPTGDVTITLSAAATAQLAIAGRLHYDIQMVTASGVTTRTEGTFRVTADVTRATS